MAYAPYTNTDVQHKVRAGLTPPPLLLGSFLHKETDTFFEYAERMPGEFPADFAPEMPHIIYVKDGMRLGRVLSTVAHVVVDEGEAGSPIMTRWPLKQHRKYPTDWVFRGPVE